MGKKSNECLKSINLDDIFLKKILMEKIIFH